MKTKYDGICTSTYVIKSETQIEPYVFYLIRTRSIIYNFASWNIKNDLGKMQSIIVHLNNFRYRQRYTFIRMNVHMFTGGIQLSKP